MNYALLIKNNTSWDFYNNLSIHSYNKKRSVWSKQVRKKYYLARSKVCYYKKISNALSYLHTIQYLHLGLHMIVTSNIWNFIYCPASPKPAQISKFCFKKNSSMHDLYKMNLARSVIYLLTFQFDWHFMLSKDVFKTPAKLLEYIKFF